MFKTGEHCLFRYDNHFLVDTLAEMGINTNYTIDGTAIVTIETEDLTGGYNHLKLKDSYKYVEFPTDNFARTLSSFFRMITCALGDFPKYLDLTECGIKGTFPFLLVSDVFLNDTNTFVEFRITQISLTMMKLDYQMRNIMAL